MMAAIRRTDTHAPSEGERIWNQVWKEIGSADTPGVTTSHLYDLNLTVQGPPGNTLSAFDELNRPSTTTDALLGVTQFGYDSLDNLTSVTDPEGLVTTYEFNGFSELTTHDEARIRASKARSAMTPPNLKTRTDAPRRPNESRDLQSLRRTLNRVGPPRRSYPDQTITYTYDSPCPNGVGRGCAR